MMKIVEWWGADTEIAVGQVAIIHRAKYPFGEHPTVTTTAVSHKYPNTGDFETGTGDSLVYYRKVN